MSYRATVVPAKAGIQEILPEKSEPATEGSGFRLSPERRVYDVIALDERIIPNICWRFYQATLHWPVGAGF